MNYMTIENENMAGVFIFSYDRSGMAGFEVYKAGGPANNKIFEIQERKGGGVLGG